MMILLTYLVSMQAAHTSLDFSGVHLLYAAPKCRLDEYTAEQTDHARRV
jgi:hypothetical protein